MTNLSRRWCLVQERLQTIPMAIRDTATNKDGTFAASQYVDTMCHLDDVGEPYSAGERVVVVDDRLPAIAIPAVQLHAPAALAKVVDIPGRQTTRAGQQAREGEIKQAPYHFRVIFWPATQGPGKNYPQRRSWFAGQPAHQKETCTRNTAAAAAAAAARVSCVCFPFRHKSAFGIVKSHHQQREAEPCALGRQQQLPQQRQQHHGHQITQGFRGITRKSPTLAPVHGRIARQLIPLQVGVVARRDVGVGQGCS